MTHDRDYRALHQNPGLAFHGCDDLRVLHGVLLDEARPVTLRVGAGRAVKREGFYLTPVELRTVKADGREVLNARAEVVLPNRNQVVTLGVNWYVNRFVKIQANFIREQLDDASQGPAPPQTTFTTKAVRFQLYF